MADKTIRLLLPLILGVGMFNGTVEANVQQDKVQDDQTDRQVTRVSNSSPQKTKEGVLQLEAVIRGNQQQPKVLTIVPWQSPEKRNTLPSPVLQQVNRRLQPIERRNFLQEQRLLEKLSK